MFRQEGIFTGKVLEVMCAEPKFNPDDPNAFDICVKVKGPDLDGKPQEDWWRGEISEKYGVGNFANKTRREITLGDLRKIGFEGNDLSKLGDLVGKDIEFTVASREHDGKTYYDVKYIGNDFKPKKLDPNTLQARMAAQGLTGAPPTGGATQQAAPAQPAQAAAPAQQEAEDWG